MSFQKKLLQWLRHKLRPDIPPDFNDIGIKKPEDLRPGNRDHIRSNPDSGWYGQYKGSDERRKRGQRGQ